MFNNYDTTDKVTHFIQNNFSTFHRYKSTTENRVGCKSVQPTPKHSTADVLNCAYVYAFLWSIFTTRILTDTQNANPSLNTFLNQTPQELLFVTHTFKLWVTLGSSGVPMGGGWEVQNPPPEIPKFWQSRTRLQIERKMFSVIIPNPN